MANRVIVVVSKSVSLNYCVLNKQTIPLEETETILTVKKKRREKYKMRTNK
eukprot:m.188296 g.188296  ORF g.188296 m.188296 type:complete len:51 (+) comp13628_c1_seq3:1907-2059(+)